jgi:hypothetical protein
MEKIQNSGRAHPKWKKTQNTAFHEPELTSTNLHQSESDWCRFSLSVAPAQSGNNLYAFLHTA